MNARGFTLVELLIALFVFAILSAFAFRAVDALSKSEAEVKAQMGALTELQRAMLFWERDMRQIVDRSAQIGFDLTLPAVGIPQDSAGNGVIEFTRGGNPDYLEQMRSSLQRVRYDVEDNVLLRKSWNIVDHVADAPPLEMPLLTKVESASVRFLRDGDWEEAPDNPDEAGGLPRAISLKLDHQRFGVITRVIPLYPQ